MNRLKMVSKGKYHQDEVKFLEPYLKDSPEHIQILILDILCLNGNPICNYVNELGDGLSSKMVSEIIKLAELQHDPFTILQLANENKKNVHAAVIALKRMGEKDLLTGLMFSGNEELSHLIGEIQ